MKKNHEFDKYRYFRSYEQYEKTYKCFEFLGPSPIDYDTHKMYGGVFGKNYVNLT